MMKEAIFCFVLCCLASLVAGQETETVSSSSEDKAAVTPSEASPDIAAIRAGSQAFVDAFNKADAKAIAAMWVEDGEYVDESGRRLAGRQAIEEGYAAFFADHPDAKIQIAIDALRKIGPHTAIEDGRAVAELDADQAGQASEYTAVHVKVGDKWLMASVRDSWMAPPAAVQSAADLEWLVGTWAGEAHGVQTESVCGWVVDGHFIERQYQTTQTDGSTSSGRQIIGWNPLDGHVQSWDFSPDGGHAVGIWTPTDDGWRAMVTGTTGDGIQTSAVNRLTRLDDNAYMWQSVQRSLGDVSLPDTDEVVIKRQPAQ